MRKLLGKTMLLAVLTAALLTVAAFAAESGTVNTNALRLRSEPSTTSPTLAYLNTGAQVDILEDLGDWYKVSYKDSTGYLFASYVSSSASASVVSTAAAESLAGETGVVTGSTVNFRSGPSTDDAVLATLSDGAELIINSITEDWCLVDWEGQEGYVKADYISVDGIPLVDPRGIITGDCVNVRSIPSTDGSIVTKVYAGNLVDLISLEDDWYAVSYDGQTGYIRSDFLRVYSGASGSGLGADIAATAQEYLGVRYVYGGASAKGFDCSGFTMYVFSLYGYSLPHSATSQWNNSGTYVAREDLQPGDLVLFCDPSRSNGKACSHVGIYIGDGDFIHASSGRSRGVTISSLSENYYDGYYVGAKRVA